MPGIGEKNKDPLIDYDEWINKHIIYLDFKIFKVSALRSLFSNIPSPSPIWCFTHRRHLICICWTARITIALIFILVFPLVYLKGSVYIYTFGEEPTLEKILEACDGKFQAIDLITPGNEYCMVRNIWLCYNRI